MKKINILFILFLLLSCNQSRDKQIENTIDSKELTCYNIVDVKEISFPLDSTKKGKPIDSEILFKRIFDYCFIDNIETLIIPINRNRLAFYNLSTHKEYHSIPISRDRDIVNFSYINKDSIYVFYESEYINYDEYESIYFQLLNYNGKPRNCNYNIDYSNFKDSSLLRTPFLIESNLHPTIIDGNVFFMANILNIENIGTKDSYNKKMPLFAYYNPTTHKIKLSKSVKFPNVEDGRFYNTTFTKIRHCKSAQNLPLLRFFYSNTLYEWDYKKDKVIKHTIKSRIIDSIPPLKNEHSSSESLEAVYGALHYDEYNKIYYSFLHLNNVLYNNYYTILILADENFNYLGEILNPHLGGNFEFYKDNIILYYYHNDSVHVRYKKLEKTEVSLQIYVDSVKKVLGDSKIKVEQRVLNFNRNETPLLSFLNPNYVLELRNEYSNYKKTRIYKMKT